jgi:hypothetical protein
MIFDPIRMILFANDGTVLKQLSCPLGIRPSETREIRGDGRSRYCSSCEKSILNLENLSDEEVRAQLQKDPDRCVFASKPSRNITFLAVPRDAERNRVLKVIKTARSIEDINAAAKNNYRPLVKKVEPSAKIKEKMAVHQNTETGEVQLCGDLRAMLPERGWQEVIPMFWYYPNVQLEPIAAYLIPKDLKVGEHVVLEDLIEDVVGSSWNQWDCYRLAISEAIWTGSDFEFDRNPPIGGFVG